MAQLQEWLFAKVAEQTERYDDMVNFAKQATKKTIQFKSQHRSLLSNAYKCKINSRRTAWRALSTLQCKQTNSKSRTGTIIQYYKETIQNQIRQICLDAIQLIDPLIKSSKVDIKSKLQFFKMKGDYYRYLCEIAHDQQQLLHNKRIKKIQKECENSYGKALDLINQESNKESMKTNPIKLAICLNYSVFYYQIMSNTAKAIQICQKGFNQALQAVSDLQDTRFTDLVTIMQLMHDNVIAWKAQLEKNQ